ncbi:hypothetical protein EG329_004566 [Mollisiaceae sp. DMI_Dod_QoI]|nr:hypothetical protein EG329_004566 [Helotiales sp. DMI_Dod_QoI]
MRFVCFHGYGTSSEIFEQQFTSIAKALGDHHEYVYLDGEVSVTRTELAGVFRGQTLGYYDGCNSEQVEQAHELITELLATEEEPFDAVLANSQGASLAISYLLHQQIQYPDKPPPFRFAVFFTPGIIISPDREYKTKEIRSFLDKVDQGDINKILAGLLDRNGRTMIEAEKFTGLVNLSARERELCLSLVQQTETLLHTRRNFKVSETNAYPDFTASIDCKDEFPRIFHPVYTDERIPIPTVHVIGSDENPAVKRLAKVAKMLCERDRVISVVHRGAHEIPHKNEGVDAVVRAIEKADFMGQRVW